MKRLIAVEIETSADGVECAVECKSQRLVEGDICAFHVCNLFKAYLEQIEGKPTTFRCLQCREAERLHVDEAKRREVTNER